jgi:hypothetical protein
MVGGKNGRFTQAADAFGLMHRAPVRVRVQDMARQLTGRRTPSLC